jgi:hypothetical protein
VLNLHSQQARNLAWLGVAAKRFLAKDQHIVDLDLKSTSAGRQKREAGEIGQKVVE